MILHGQKELVRDWIASRVRDLHDPPKDLYEAIGVVRVTKDAHGNIIHQRLIGGCLYTQYRELAPGQHDCLLTAAGEPGWLTRGAVREMLRYPFQQIACIRVTTLIAPANKASRTLNEKLGFKLEGKLRNGLGSGRHLLIYGLLKEEAERWLK